MLLKPGSQVHGIVHSKTRDIPIHAQKCREECRHRRIVIEPLPSIPHFLLVERKRRLLMSQIAVDGIASTTDIVQKGQNNREEADAYVNGAHYGRNKFVCAGGQGVSILHGPQLYPGQVEFA
ncbi:hypothetical protein CONPUDRAFT_84621 [Coniophora puteana RWD-64-598 SS2]|uniref:Uncharacterized protein n=1 Tax=Coniophora puteana (strain RWD-64-598) TaxID=741705 RepID=A0A5M3MBP8_CONPW|nr:uncharacterized protein CONPUDRAFT_84621 [Coniophora puteana RWD-64-598 SS2]EIW76658.1 hypothetical protein CONPUDRAFT_84621 [Coniophora puteana RWD-64-598 SS2]